MTVLDCNVSNCGYNDDRCCCRSEIDVKGNKADKKDDTCCGSFKKESSEFQNSSRTPNTTLNVGCEASNCVFNETYKCSAEHIGIAGSNADDAVETVCASFSCK